MHDELISKNSGGPPVVTAAAEARRQPTFAPIKAKRAFEQVCEQIRREVAAGTLRPGDRLPPERELAEQLGVSRTAIREALRSLENAGLVQCQQGMGGGAF
ncbi:MAG TPA: winged helix-turn-helix domain-containing protein, partial [Eoetvoesiella sp.]